MTSALDQAATRRMTLSALLGLALTSLPACRQNDNGPGMVVTYSGMIEGLKIDLKVVRLPDGINRRGTSFGGSRKWGWRGGATAGLAGDQRDLPEWVEFEWQELVHASLRREDFPSEEAYGEAVAKKYRDAPIKIQRVPVRSRVPRDVVDEVIYANTHVPPGETLPTKMLWVYFIWTERGVRFRWMLRDRSIRPELEREGGDDPAEF